MTTALEQVAERQAALLDRYEHGEDARDAAATAKNEELDAFINNAGLAVKQSAGGALVCFKTTGGQDTWFYSYGKVSWFDLRPDGMLGGPADIHESFLINGVERETVYVAAYPLSLSNGEVVSQPNKLPYTGRTFDEALALCAATQIAGHENEHRLMSNFDWSLVSYSCVANQYQPIGNTNYGNSHEKTHISGRGSTKTETGSLGDQSSSTGSMQGVYDLVGNVWEMVCGVEIRDGEVYVSVDNGSSNNSDNYISIGHWYSGSSPTGNGVPSIVTDIADISRNGDTGDNSTDYYDSISGASGFASLAGTSSTLMKRLCLAPIGDGTDPDGALYSRNYGTRICLRGGNNGRGASAGIGALDLKYTLLSSNGDIGFRSAFVI